MSVSSARSDLKGTVEELKRQISSAESLKNRCITMKTAIDSGLQGLPKNVYKNAEDWYITAKAEWDYILGFYGQQSLKEANLFALLCDNLNDESAINGLKKQVNDDINNIQPKLNELKRKTERLEGEGSFLRQTWNDTFTDTAKLRSDIKGLTEALKRICDSANENWTKCYNSYTLIKGSSERAVLRPKMIEKIDKWYNKAKEDWTFITGGGKLEGALQKAKDCDTQTSVPLLNNWKDQIKNDITRVTGSALSTIIVRDSSGGDNLNQLINKTERIVKQQDIIKEALRKINDEVYGQAKKFTISAVGNNINNIGVILYQTRMQSPNYKKIKDMWAKIGGDQTALDIAINAGNKKTAMLNASGGEDYDGWKPTKWGTHKADFGGAFIETWWGADGEEDTLISVDEIVQSQQTAPAIVDVITGTVAEIIKDKTKIAEPLQNDIANSESTSITNTIVSKDTALESSASSGQKFLSYLLQFVPKIVYDKFKKQPTQDNGENNNNDDYDADINTEIANKSFLSKYKYWMIGGGVLAIIVTVVLIKKFR